MTSNPALTTFRDNKWTHHILLEKGLQIARELIKVQRGKDKAGRRQTDLKKVREVEKCPMEHTVLYTVVRVIYISRTSESFGLFGDK